MRQLGFIPPLLAGIVAVLAYGGTAAAATQLDRPLLLAAPQVLGTPALGASLSTDNGIWSSALPFTLTYEWQRCDSAGANCRDIDGEISSTYVPKFFQVRPGATIRVAVTAWSIGGPTTGTSAAVGPLKGATSTLVSAPSVTGDAQVGGVLTVSSGFWVSLEPYFILYEWLRCWPDQPSSCTVIPYGRGPVLTVGPLDAGWLVQAQVTARTSSGDTSALTAQLLIPGPPPGRFSLHATDLGVLTIGHSYDVVLWSGGGGAPYAWSGWGGAPQGMTITPDGHLVGRPTVTQDSGFGGQITDTTGRVATAAFMFRVVTAYAVSHGFAALTSGTAGAAPTSGSCAVRVGSDTLWPSWEGLNNAADLRVGQVVSGALVRGGTPPYALCIVAGSLPPGLAINKSTGAIKGKLTKPGGYTITLAVVDADGSQNPVAYRFAFIVAPAVPHPKRRHRRSDW